MVKRKKELRVIAPSRSMVIINEETINIANEYFVKKNIDVTFGNNIMKNDSDYNCASIDNRIIDLHDAFRDKNVSYILTAIGGYNANQLLPYIDYDLIKKNKKVFCGYSDITILLNAIYAKTKMITYYGPHYSTFGILKGNEYTQEYFEKLILKKEPITIKSSFEYSDDPWYIDQNNRNFIKNPGMKVINNGQAEGIILGGNLCTFILLQGTPYMPKTKKDIILFLEDDGETNENFLVNFDRNLVSLIQNDLFHQVKGIVFGRSQLNCQMTENKWRKLLAKKELINIPIVIDADFGHTDPKFCFPIGGKCKIDFNNDHINIEIE